MNLDTDSFRPALKAWMDYRKLDQGALASKSKVDQQTLSAILGGRQKSIRFPRVQMLSRALELPVEVLLLCLKPSDLFRSNSYHNRLLDPNGSSKLTQIPGGFDLLLAQYFCRRFNGLGADFNIQVESIRPSYDDSRF